MDKESKKEILQAIDAFDVSYIRTPDQIIYDIENDAGAVMSLCALLYQKPNSTPVLQYIIEVNKKIIEEVDVEPYQQINEKAQDIIELMQKCARKVMYQQMTLLQNKYMHHHAYSSKEHS